jgi:phosphoglycerate dehydrogenase-like enzyme
LITLPEGELFNSFISKETIKLLEDNFEVSYNPKCKNFTPEQLYEFGKDKDILITGWGTPSLKKAGFYEKENNLKMLAHTGGSVADYVDNEAYARGIKVVSGNVMYAESTAEGTLSYILSGLRYIPDDVNLMHGDYWVSPYKTRGLLYKTVGIIGVGAVAKKLMEYLKPFKVNIKVFDIYQVDKTFLQSVNAVQTSLEEVLSTSDIVSVHLALNEKTKDFIGKEQLAMLKDGALFVNTSRGHIIDEDALVKELEKNRISAVLDVFKHEPLECNDPLRKLKNVYLIPHKAGPTYDYRSVIGYKIAQDVVNFKENRPLNYEITAKQAERMTKHS